MSTLCMQLCWDPRRPACVIHPSMSQHEQDDNNRAGEAAQSEQEPSSRHPYELKSLHLWSCRPVHYLADVQVMSVP